MTASLDGFIARKDGRVDWLETSDEFVGGARTTRRALGRGSEPWRCLFACLALISAAMTLDSATVAASRHTSWEIQKPEEDCHVLFFDPKAPGVSLPAGLRFVVRSGAKSARVQESLKNIPSRPIRYSHSSRSPGEGLPHRRQSACHFLRMGGSGGGSLPLTFTARPEISKDVFDDVIAPSLRSSARDSGSGSQTGSCSPTCARTWTSRRYGMVTLAERPSAR